MTFDLSLADGSTCKWRLIYPNVQNVLEVSRCQSRTCLCGLPFANRISILSTSSGNLDSHSKGQGCRWMVTRILRVEKKDLSRGAKPSQGTLKLPVLLPCDMTEWIRLVCSFPLPP